MTYSVPGLVASANTRLVPSVSLLTRTNSVSEIHAGSEYLAFSEKVVDWPVLMSRTLMATAWECDSNEYVVTGSPAQEGRCQPR